VGRVEEGVLQLAPVAGEQPDSEFADFVRQERADADERLNLRRVDPMTPFGRAISFLDAVQTNIRGREAVIATMKGDLRLFTWERRPDRIYLRASDYEMVIAPADDKGNLAVNLQQYRGELGSRTDPDPYDVPGLGAALFGTALAGSKPREKTSAQTIDVSKLKPDAIRKRAVRLLIDFLKAAYA
jgi:hypothetical protein